jgi:hypothetical protein
VLKITCKICGVKVSKLTSGEFVHEEKPKGPPHKAQAIVNGNYLATFSVIPKHGAPCPCCGQDECPCSIQDDIEYSDPEVGYRDFVSLCVLHKKRVD